MVTGGQRGERRADALTKERIVAAAIEILDLSGEDGLTFRALGTHLSTGSGAIYWHVANKRELLAAATNGIVAKLLAQVIEQPAPDDAIRSIALGVFDAIDGHPWVGSQLALGPSESAMLSIFEGVGGRLHDLGIGDDQLFVTTSTVVSFIVGVAVQNGVNARRHAGHTDRSEFLAGTADRWASLDPDEFPVLRLVSAQMRDHDDRDQFLGGIDLLLAGIATLR